jgi:NAD(P)-dependent dehydrogenase (short-subunit alcohol dehydrogenase family)
VSVLETDEEVWDRVFAINLKGMVWVCKYGIPYLISGGGGAIVNVGSTSALLGDTIPQDAYTASKGAVISLTRNLGVQFAPQGIRANCIHPGFTDTPMQTVAHERPGMGRGRDRRDPAWPARNRAGYRARSAVPRERRGRLRDGNGARRGRWRGRRLRRPAAAD